jgi:hypothetical protein
LATDFGNLKVINDLIKRDSRTGRVAQVVECLPGKREALNSIPNASKKERKILWQ